MGRTSRFVATFLAALATAWQPVAAHATEEETQLWLMLDASLPLDARTEATFLVMPRLRDERFGQDQIVLRAAIDHDLGAVASIGGGLTYVVGPDSLRPFQQVELASKGFGVRFRLEEVIGGGVDRMGLRERVQLRYKWKPADRLSATLAGEWIDSVRSENRDSLPARDQWRAAITLRRELDAHLHAGLGYTLIAAPARDHLPTRIIHAPLLSAGWSF